MRHAPTAPAAAPVIERDRPHRTVGLRIDLTSGYGRELFGGVVEYANQVNRWTIVGPFLLGAGPDVTMRAPDVDGILAMVGGGEIRVALQACRRQEGPGVDLVGRAAHHGDGAVPDGGADRLRQLAVLPGRETGGNLEIG